MKIASAAEMREIDRVTIEERGMPASALMGFAGKASADFILNTFKDHSHIGILCGQGNNGGDGFVIAYQLHQAGKTMEIMVIGDESKYSPETNAYYNLCKKSGIPLSRVEDEAQLPDFDDYDLIIDAIFGTGFNGTPMGISSILIKSLNDAEATVVSIDVPSGLPSDGPIDSPLAVIADYTVTIGLPKDNLVTYPGINYAGNLHVAEIGFPNDLLESQFLLKELIDQSFLSSVFFREREDAYRSMPEAHKGKKGRVLLVGGFDGMEGAIIMSAMSALACGVGLVTILTTPDARRIIAGRAPECITAAVPPDADNNSYDVFITELLSSKRFDVLVIGPGLGRGKPSSIIFDCVLKRIKDGSIKTAVIDGDALRHLGDCGKLMLDMPGVIITPHFGEASHLLKEPIEKIGRDRIAAARRLSDAAGCTALLKGPASIIACKDRLAVNTTGNPALAAGGSGDVLSGMIAAFSLRGFAAFEAASLGAYFHGLAGDIHVSENSGAMSAMDILPCIRKAIDSSLCANKVVA
jgi:NAD(P)H-hydrate epimerase